MKKTLLALALLIGIFSTGRAQIVITEIMYNPPESGTDSLEFLELYNNSNATVDITGWVLQYGASSFTIPALNIPAGQYHLFTSNATAFQNNFGLSSTQWTSGALGNNGATIRLSDAAANIIDEVTYDDVAPWPTSPDQMGPSLVLCDPNSDNSLAANWQAATTPTNVTIAGILILANPNAASGCNGANQITANDDNFSAPTGQAAIFNVQTNDLIVNPLTSFTITNQPAHGTATIVGNGISYQSGNGYCGPDQLTYKICDANGCDEATVMVNVKCYPQRTIGLMTSENASSGVADSLNATCELQGTVYGVNLRPINNSQPSLLFTIIDNNGHGIAVSTLGGNFGYTVTEKDKVVVRGTIGQFNGQTEIRPDTIIKISANNALLTPTIVTNLSEATESKLVKLTFLHLVDPTEWTTGVGTSGFNVRAVSDAHPADTIQIRIDHDVETYNAPAPCAVFNLTGIGGQFDATNPFNSGYQILPRYNADIDCNVSTHEADYSTLVSIAPNPVNSQISIEMTTSFDRLSLLNVLGQEIKTYVAPGMQQKVDVSGYKPGVYFVRFEKDGKSWTTRFIKQ